MSFANQKFAIPRKYQCQIDIWYFCPKFLGIFLVFYRYFENDLVKIWLNIDIFLQNKIGLVFGFCSCHFICIDMVSVCHCPENDISIFALRAQRKTRLPLSVTLIHDQNFVIIYYNNIIVGSDLFCPVAQPGFSSELAISIICTMFEQD